MKELAAVELREKVARNEELFAKECGAIQAHQTSGVAGGGPGGAEGEGEAAAST